MVCSYAEPLNDDLANANIEPTSRHEQIGLVYAPKPCNQSAAEIENDDGPRNVMA